MGTFVTGIPLSTRDIQPPPNTTKITINKTVTGTSIVSSFLVNISGAVNYVGLPLTKNEPIVLNNVPYGDYVITEQADVSYSLTSITPSSFTLNALNPQQVITITNDYFKGIIEVSKVIKETILNVEYGFLYNWYAANDVRGIASTGWHLPTEAEFITLYTYLGGTLIAGGPAKETGYVHWNAPNTGATNSSGFTAKASGRRTNVGVFQSLAAYLLLWTSTPATNGKLAFMIYNGANLATGDASYKVEGLSVRLIKDSTILTNGQTGTYIGNDGKSYGTICIGTQEWLAVNLCETKFRDGSSIYYESENSSWKALTTSAYCAYGNLISYAYTSSTSVISDNTPFDITVTGRNTAYTDTQTVDQNDNVVFLHLPYDIYDITEAPVAGYSGDIVSTPVTLSDLNQYELVEITNTIN